MTVNYSEHLISPINVSNFNLLIILRVVILINNMKKGSKTQLLFFLNKYKLKYKIKNNYLL